VSKSGSLYFSSVTSADDAAYYCTVSIEGGGTESRTSAAYNLIVDTSPSELPALYSNSYPAS